MEKSRLIFNVKLPDLSPEMRLVLACARTSMREEDREKVKMLSHKLPDWGSFIKLVDRHRVYPMAYRNLRKLVGTGLPEQVLSSLQERFERNTQRGLALTAELVRLVELFEKSGIPVMPLKGPVLALQIYGDLSLRHAGDLDIFVHPKYVKLADQLLTKSGYQRTNPAFALGPVERKYSERMFQHLEYLKSDSRISIELHSRLQANLYSFPLNIDQIWARPQISVIAGTRVRTLPLKETLLYLCMHGAYHVWFRLFWLCDLAQLQQKNATIDWAGLMARAVELGIQRPLAQGLVLSHLLLGNPLPNPVQTYAEQDRAMPRLIEAGLCGVLDRGLDPKPRSVSTFVPQKLNEIKLRRDLRYKMRCLTVGLTSTEDWNILRLPDVLFPLYFVLRPFLWFWRWYLKGPPQGRNVSSSRRAKNLGEGHI